MIRSVPRFDSYSVREYGETVTVFRLQDGGPFYSEIGGKRKVIRKPNKKKIWNERDARTWARDKHREIRKGEPEHPTLSAIFDSYLEHRSPVKATKQGRKDDKRRAEMWKAFLGPTRDPASITRGDLDSFIQKRGYRVIDSWGRNPQPVRDSNASSAFKLASVRPRTVQADIQWLSTVLRRKLTDHCNVPSLRDIARDLHQSAEPRRPVATQDRYEAIMAYLKEKGRGKHGYLPELLVLVAGTGHRLSEILNLRYADMLLDSQPSGALRWRAENTGNKARLGRIVPIRPEVRRVLEQIQRERPGIGEAWLFPGLRNPRKPTHRSVADAWLRAAEKAAGLQPLNGSLWHSYRRKWATERKHLPGADVAYAGGWKNERTLQSVYQQADAAGVLRVVLDATELREEKA